MGDHADEIETSLMLHLRPDLVLPREYWGEGNEKKLKIKAFNEGWAWTERKWSQISTDTGVGDPRLATEKKGKSYFEDITLLISELIIELCLANTSDLYE